ncbi:MAG: hypothetical protein WDN75_17930 [Bacteroidota bacterium]
MVWDFGKASATPVTLNALLLFSSFYQEIEADRIFIAKVFDRHFFTQHNTIDVS